MIKILFFSNGVVNEYIDEALYASIFVDELLSEAGILIADIGQYGCNIGAAGVYFCLTACEPSHRGWDKYCCHHSLHVFAL